MVPMLAWLPSLLLLLTGGQSVTSAPSATSGLPALHPMAAAEHGGGGVGSLLPQAALAAAVAALDELQEDNDRLFDAEPEKEPQRPKLTRRQRRKKDVKTCAWAQLVEDEDLKDPTSINAKNFREDFRVPYCFFLRLVEVVKSKEWFPTAEHDAYGRPCHPVEHKVLACLTILGRGNCFQSIYLLSWMSKTLVQSTFHKFCENFATEMYDEHIFLPSDENGELDRVMGQYEKVGFPGAVGSTDVTHIGWSRCPYNQARSYTGKEGKPTVGYQVTVNHSGRVLAVTEGFTGSTNDKTIICWDAAVAEIRTNPKYTEKEFNVYNEDGTTRTLKGCYLIVDNGYHKWRVLMEPSKYPGDESDLLFSKRLESVRKDVERFFGILKIRFRILKIAMTYQQQKRIDYVFFTCCILHNMLHTYDGMDNLSENVNWVGSAELRNTWEHNKDTSSVGAKDENEKPHVEAGHALLKKQLTTSYVYRKKIKKDIVWLSR